MSDMSDDEGAPGAEHVREAIEGAELADAERALLVALLCEDIDARGLPSVQRDRVTQWRQKARSLATALESRDAAAGGEAE